MDLLSRFKLWYNTQPPAIRMLLTINVVLYLLWNLVFTYFSVAHLIVAQWLALTPEAAVVLVRPWQLVTYNFLHTGPGLGGLLHVLFNMLWLVWIGRDHENLHGSADLMGLYLLGGIGGGLMSVALHTAFPGIGAFGGPIVGASASVLAIMAAVATRYPNTSIGLLFLGVVPLRYIVLGFLFLDLLFFSTTSSAVGAHLGGALSGFLIARSQLSGRNLTGWAGMFFPNRRKRGQREPMLGHLESWLEERQSKRTSARRGRNEPGRTTPNPRMHRVPLHEGEPELPRGDTVIDHLLDKINEHGYESLTAEEKRILYEASNK